MTLREDPAARYEIQSVLFAPDLSSFMIRFIDPERQRPPVNEVTEWAVELGGELQEQAAAIYDQLCDLIDESYKEGRRRNG
jgi:hypothetical protein